MRDTPVSVVYYTGTNLPALREAFPVLLFLHVWNGARSFPSLSNAIYPCIMALNPLLPVFLIRYSVFFLYIFCHITVAVLKTCPDIIQRVCPQSVLITVLPCMASGCNWIVLLIDQYCFNFVEPNSIPRYAFPLPMISFMLLIVRFLLNIIFLRFFSIHPLYYFCREISISISPAEYNLLPVILYLIICGMQRCSTGVHF